MQTLNRLRVFCASRGLQNANNSFAKRQHFLIAAQSLSCTTLVKPFTFSNSKEVGRSSIAPKRVNGVEINLAIIFPKQQHRDFHTASVNHNCWNCGSSAPSFFCSFCKVIQPPDGKASYFEIMDCEQTFALDTQRLQRRYLQLQRSLHPDNFSQKTSKEQENSVDQSALVNKAYRTLLKPLTRGLYMLELQGLHLEEGTDLGADPEFLLEVMELNETLAETWSKDEVNMISHSVRDRLTDLTEQINTSLNKGDLQSAKVLLAQMKYFANIEEKVKEKLSECL